MYSVYYRIGDRKENTIIQAEDMDEATDKAYDWGLDSYGVEPCDWDEIEIRYIGDM